MFVFSPGLITVKQQLYYLTKYNKMLIVELMSQVEKCQSVSFRVCLKQGKDVALALKHYLVQQMIHKLKTFCLQWCRCKYGNDLYLDN